MTFKSSIGATIILTEQRYNRSLYLTVLNIQQYSLCPAIVSEISGYGVIARLVLIEGPSVDRSYTGGWGYG